MCSTISNGNKTFADKYIKCDIQEMESIAVSVNNIEVE